MKIAEHRKLIAAALGILALVGTRYGFDLQPHIATLADAGIALLTLFGVYQSKNTPPNVPNVSPPKKESP